MKEVVQSKILVPRFATEREEADWWYANREMVEEEIINVKRQKGPQGSVIFALEPVDPDNPKPYWMDTLPPLPE